MTDTPADAERVDEINRAFDVYGADFGRWPAQLRVSLQAEANETAFDEKRREAAELDAALNEATPAEMDEGFLETLKMDYEQSISTGPAASSMVNRALNWILRALSADRDSRPVRWGIPGAAYVAIGLLGFFSGGLSSNVALTPEEEFLQYAYDDGSLSVYSMLEEE